MGESMTGEKSHQIWSILPTFDPTSDDPKEYGDKVRFIAGICPVKDKPMLAPRLAMLMKGTAWAQVKGLSAETLADPAKGVEALLKAVSTWEEAAELQTYDKFEKAIYKVLQRNDETNLSYVNRLNVAFLELGKVDLTDMKAFILLRQSALTPEDKKKVITMTSGELEASKIEAAMRSLATRVLGGQQEQKKKIYPVNHVDDEPEEVHFTWEEEPWDEETAFQAMSEMGDEDAQVVQDFEDQLLDICQESPELSLCFSAYSDARARLREKTRSRGFWPTKGGKGKGKKGGKGGGKRRSSMTLADRIATSTCRVCGKMGHWKWECPRRASGSNQNPSSADANVVMQVEHAEDGDEIYMDLPKETVVLALDELVQDQWGLLISQNPLELNCDSKREPRVNEEFIFMAGKCSISLAKHMDVANMITRLSRVMGVVGCDRTSEPEPSVSILSAACFCPGIIDTGASRSVIGQQRVKNLMQGLPLDIQKKAHWGKSETVFRFGNNGTLGSIGALYLPFGDRWLRLEVVKGNTPFLLSNAFLQATAADVRSATSELFFRESGNTVPLTLNEKGLFTVDLAEVLTQGSSSGSKKVGSAAVSEVVTLTMTEHVNNSESTAAKVAQPPEQLCDFVSDRDLCSNRDHGEAHLQGLDRPDGEGPSQKIKSWSWRSRTNSQLCVHRESRT